METLRFKSIPGFTRMVWLLHHFYTFIFVLLYYYFTLYNNNKCGGVLKSVWHGKCLGKVIKLLFVYTSTLLVSIELISSKSGWQQLLIVPLWGMQIHNSLIFKEIHPQWHALKKQQRVPIHTFSYIVYYLFCLLSMAICYVHYKYWVVTLV